MSLPVQRAASDLVTIITTAASLLPAQGPITSFAFLNPLEGLESLRFHEGLQLGARLNRCEPYLPEARYRELMASHRINAADLEAALKRELGDRANEVVIDHCTRFQLRLALLKYTFPNGQAEELQWVMEETDALTRCRAELGGSARQAWLDQVRNWVAHQKCEGRVPLNDLLAELGEYDLERVADWPDDAWQSAALRLLWSVCLHGVSRGEVVNGVGSDFPPVRHREALLSSEAIDSDVAVLEVLQPYCAAFIDQGLSQWKIPGRDAGYLQCFAALYDDRLPTRWGKRSAIAEALRRVRAQAVSADELIEESLAELGVMNDEREEYLTASLLAFKGWAGMLWQMEIRGDRVPQPVPQGTLIEFLAVQLLLERWSLDKILQGRPGPRVKLEDARCLGRDTNGTVRHPEQWAFKVFQLAQVLGWNISKLAELDDTQWQALMGEVASFPFVERRRLFHAAYERHYRVEALDAFATFCHRRPQCVQQPKFQAMFCIDAREESFRRHIEEIEPQAETFANAGFYNVPIYYRGAADAHYTALCPIVVRPKHWVTEEVAVTMEEEHRRRSHARKVLGGLSQRIHHGSRNVAAGALLSAGVGVLASVPLVMRILFPGMSARLRRTANRFVSPPPSTRLRLERTSEEPGPDGAGIGLNLKEMVEMGERALRDTGLTSNFAPIVVFFGHCSACLNNPHKSTYDCGACTGNPGGPNARALAMILNDRRVRTILAERGIEIPHGTAFIGGMHNTGNDTVQYFDLDLLPVTLLDAFREVRDIVAEACERNAHERARRFHSIPLDVLPRQAHRLVDERTEDLAQTRPEYGNCTNALCFVGRRSRIRGMYLDRRAFLMSYDHDQDDDQAMILGRILGAVVPVCSGINLQYTLSATDPPGWGAGTKLPHNVTSLLGVMDGAASDLRSGLPWQSTDIHEPMRLVFIMESTPERMQALMARSPVVDRILRNGWAQLALLNPHSSSLLYYSDGAYLPYQPNQSELPQVTRSADWYSGHREHLGFAVIEQGLIAGQELFEEGGR